MEQSCGRKGQEEGEFHPKIYPWGWILLSTPVITEAGWATVASEFGERANEKAQARYYQEMKAWAEKTKITIFFFEALDEDWKGDPNNPLGAEKHWGIYDINRKPKKVMQSQVRE